MDTGTSPIVGLVIGTEPATPLEFWVAVAEGSYLQLDDVVMVERVLPDGQILRISGVVSQVRAVHEGARMESDVFLVDEGILPAQVSEAAQVLATRFEPEVYVPPLPGEVVRKAKGGDNWPNTWRRRRMSSSRPKMTITTQSGITPQYGSSARGPGRCETIQNGMNVDAISSLSAIGSHSFPKSLIQPCLRAR